MLKIICFHYLFKYFLDQSIQKRFNSILNRSTARLATDRMSAGREVLVFVAYSACPVKAVSREKVFHTLVERFNVYTYTILNCLQGSLRGLELC